MPVFMPDNPSTLDLEALVASLRRHAATLVAVALAVGVLVAGGFALLGKHYAEAVYTLGSLRSDEKREPPLRYVRGIDPQEFKTIAPRFDANGFRAFAERLPEANPDAVERALKSLAIEARRRELLSPLYGTTRGDLRELGEASRPQENAVLGLQLVHGARNRERALEVVQLVGDFVGEVVFRTEVRNVMQQRVRETDAERLLAENDLIKARFEMGQLESKGKELGKLREEFPELTRGQAQQVISLAEGGQRYLSPAAQMVGVESKLADHREDIGTAQRKMRKGEQQQGYYSRALALAAEPIGSTALLEQLARAVAEYFPADNDQAGVSAEARNEALLELGAFTALRTRGLQFVVKPAITEREPAQLFLYGLLAVLATLVAGTLILLAREWWRPGQRPIAT